MQSRAGRRLSFHSAQILAVLDALSHMPTNEARVSLCWHAGLCSTVIDMFEWFDLLADGWLSQDACIKGYAEISDRVIAMPFVSGSCRAYTSRIHHACCSTSGREIQVAHPFCLNECTCCCSHKLPSPELQAHSYALCVCQTQIIHCAFHHTLLHGGADLHVMS